MGIDKNISDHDLKELIRSRSKLYTAYSVKDKEGKYRSVVDIESVVILIRDQLSGSVEAKDCEHPFERLSWVKDTVFCNKCHKTLVKSHES